MDSKYIPENQIIVVGYPKSGNTYLSRLLGDILNSPVMGAHGALPLATEGKEREGNFTIRQLHLKPVYKDGEDFIANAWEANIPSWDGERIIFIKRDPRDVIVSVKHYWDIPTIRAATTAVARGGHPLTMFGSISDFISAWRDDQEADAIVCCYVCFEDLIEFPEETIRRIGHLSALNFTEDKITSALRNQSLSEKRKQIEIDGEGRPYGKAIQLKNLRAGRIGDWKKEFSNADITFYDMVLGAFHVKEFNPGVTE